MFYEADGKHLPPEYYRDNVKKQVAYTANINSSGSHRTQLF